MISPKFLVVLAAAALGLCSCAGMPPEAPAPELLEALVDERLEPDAAARCAEGTNSEFVAAFETTATEIRSLVPAGKEDAASVDLLPDVGDYFVCIERLAVGDGANVVVATWIAWDTAGNRPAGFVDQFCETPRGFEALAACA